jgi:hypothetical protein
MKPHHTTTAKIIILGLILAAGLHYVVAAGSWVAPPSNPPNGNIDTPINAGRSDPDGYQAKLGALWLNTDTANPQTVGLYVQNGQSWFNGALKITDGTQGANKVLTSDANGVTSWQNSTGGSGGPVRYTSLTSSSGTYTVPSGITRIVVHVVGGGAAGEANGGMGGGYATAIRAVTPGQQITYDVGTGGVAVCDTAASGNDSKFDKGAVTGTTIVAYGGNGTSSIGNLTYPVSASTDAGWSGGDWGAFGRSWLDTGAIIQSQNGDKVPGYPSGFPFSRGGGATTNMPQSLTAMLPLYGGGGNGDKDGGGGLCGGNGANGIIIVEEFGGSSSGGGGAPTIVRRTVQTNGGSSSATCNSGETLIGGGCSFYSDGTQFKYSNPNASNTSWDCGQYGTTFNGQYYSVAYAMCATY